MGAEELHDLQLLHGYEEISSRSSKRVLSCIESRELKEVFVVIKFYSFYCISQEIYLIC